MNNKFNITLQLIVTLIALIALVIAYWSYKTGERISQIAEQTNQIAERISQIAEQTNQIAERSYEVLYRSNLPVISAIVKTYYGSYYGEEDYGSTEQLMVYNGGRPVSWFVGDAHLLMRVWFADKSIQTYIPLRGYFGNTEYTGSGQGLLLTVFRNNNISDYWSISGDFRQAAFEDGYEPFMQPIYILCATYPYSGEYCNEYLEVSSVGSWTKGEAEAREILDSADRSEELANSWGLSLYIWGLNGRDLWNWYKAAILQD